MCAMCSSAATPPRSCWTGQLTEQVLTARSCTCTAQQATSCGAARMGSGGTLSTIIKARRCEIPPDICTPRQLSANGATLERGVDDHRHLVKLPGRRFAPVRPEFSGRRRKKRDTDVPGSLRHCHCGCGRGRLRRCKL